MWDALTIDEAKLEAVEAPRLVVDACPKCGRRARLVEHAEMREGEATWLPWAPREVARRVLRCEKCAACFELPAEGLPPWVEAPQARERNLELARLRARWRNATQEAVRWRQRSDLAVRRGDAALADEARRMASRFEGEAHAAKTEIERLGGELPQAPKPDPEVQRIEDELSALRERAAAKKAAQAQESATPEVAAPAASSDAAPQEPAPQVQPTDAEPAPTGDVVEDELAALKRKMRKDPEVPRGTAPTPASAPQVGEEDELAALKRKLKPRS